MSPTLSVVVPSYNSVRFIDEAVRSILDQRDVDLELVVADHSSTDGTWERLQSYADDPRVTLVQTPPGGGAELNFNRVTDLATGTYLKLVCGDDLLSPGTLARQVGLLERNPGAVMTAAPRDLVDANGKPFFRSWGIAGLEGVMSGRSAIRATVRRGTNVFGEPHCVTLRRDALVAAGGWDFAQPFLVDEATYVRVLLQGDFVTDPEVGGAFRVNLGQTSVALSRRQSAQVVAFHRWLAENHPGVVSAADVRLGNLRARLMAYQRRLTYAVLRRRLG